MNEYPVQCAAKDCDLTGNVADATKDFTCTAGHRNFLRWERGGEAGVKCYAEPVPVVEVGEEPPPYGGALSYAEYDDYQTASDREYKVWEEQSVYEQLFRNIMNSDMPMGQKLSSVETATTEFARRAQQVETGERSLTDRVKALFSGGGEKAAPPTPLAEKKPPTALFHMTKDANGAARWVATHTNKFRDREHELFSEAAHKDYEAWVDRTGNYPELRLWHTPYSRIGQCDFVGVIDGFVLSSGVFDPGTEAVQQSLAAMAEKDGLALSHGYFYRDEDVNVQEGVYDRYRSYEISILPVGAEANPLTNIEFDGIEQLKEATMLAPAKRAFLEAAGLPPERITSIEEKLTGLTKELEDSGVGFKALGLKEDEPAAPTTQPPAASGEEAPAATAEAPASEAPAEAPAADGEEKPADGEEGEESEAEKGLAALGVLIEDSVKSAVAPYAAAITELQSQVKELKADDDTKIATAMEPRTQVAAATAERPSESADTEIENQKEVAAATEQLGEKGDEGNAAMPYLKQMLGQSHNLAP